MSRLVWGLTFFRFDNIHYVDQAMLEGLNLAEFEVVDRIRARRVPGPLQALDLTLLHSLPVADGWNLFLGSIRAKTTLPAAFRKLLIYRVAICNSAWYEWDDHVTLAMRVGLSAEAMELIKQRNLSNVDSTQQEKAGMGNGEWAALMITDEMTNNVKVREERFRKLQEHFGSRELVEIIATIGCYNCVSRFLLALDVGERNETDLGLSEDNDTTASSPQAAYF
ncbi:hypothetical protein DL762_006852 [Monosporascus cannonballus]|uniref:Carboxymuconolactone decarboxylase-like domain-containing protein n=1 Tax=Monosporascus cannonballus TaxID=155416 RepID=A0ABY0H1C6_9PEZI|nr:hypothetical protein DL762_006852 [Monosporascus cannonballus]RYO84967.1 hypothetical protein DL763_007279 [Monosporascus cannonballus]